MLHFNTILGLTKWFVVLPVLALGQRYMTREMAFYKIEGKSLVGNVTAVRQVKDFFDCSFLCMEYGHEACLSFNLERSNDNNYNCELSNSEKYLEPQKMQDRSGYDYYGTTFKSLFRLRPCLNSPCSYGGTCINGPGLDEFSCQCKPEVSVLPFIDIKCNVDTNDLYVSSSTQGVVMGQAIARYKLNYYDAKRLCALLGATQATYNQLYAAWEAGLELCSYGWLADGTISYPMHQVRSGCGNTVGIIRHAAAKTTKKNAWCYKNPCLSSPCSHGGTCNSGPGLDEFSCQCKPEVSVLPFIDNKCNVDTNDLFVGSSTQGVFIGKANGRYNLNYYDAKRFCELLGASLATYNQLYAAWEAGLELCSYGWLTDSTYRYPMHQVKSGCGNSVGIIGSSAPKDKTVKKDAWCYKQS